jgi:hypothetical protein
MVRARGIVSGRFERLDLVSPSGLPRIHCVCVCVCVCVSISIHTYVSVADSSNNRVLLFPAGSTTAIKVWGQGGNFTSISPGVTATALYLPSGLALDSSGNLYLSDTNSNRVLFFFNGSTTASRVYGQGGLFTSGIVNYPSGSPSATSLNYPLGIALDSNGGLYGPCRDTFQH